MQVSVRHARPEEAVALSSLAMESKAHWGYPAEWLELWRDELTIDAGYIEQHEVLVALKGDALAGFAAVLPGQKQFELAHFWVAPTCMGQGIGRILFSAIIRCTSHNGKSGLRIVSDPQALGFYLAMGCERIGDEPTQIAGRLLPVLSHPL